MVHTAQIGRDVLRARDSDEDRLVALRRDLELDLAELARIDEPVDAIQVDVEVLGGQSTRAGGEALAVGRQVTLVVLLPVGPQCTGP